MFERFTDKARRAVTLAQEEARALGHDHIGTEHLLLGLIAVEDGVGARVLHGLGAKAKNVRAQVEARAVRGAGTTRAHIPFTPRAKKTLETALREALKMGHRYIGTEHLMLSLLREEDGLAAEILTDLGVTYEEARRGVVVFLGTGSLELVQGTLATVLPAFSRSRAAHKQSSAGEPLCPHCKASLTGAATYRIVEVPAQDGDGTAHVLFLFCSSCGTTLDDVILPGE